MPSTDDPARLVQRGRPPCEKTVELAAVGDVREQVQEIPGVGGREPLEAPREATLALGREMDVGEELREVVGARRLADAVVRPLVDAFRNGPPPREGPRDVSAVHLRVDEAEASHERVDTRAAAARRASEQHLELVCGDIVRVDEGTVQETVCIRARRGLAGKRPQRLDRDCELQRRSGWKGRAGVPGRACPGREVADVDGAGAREGAHERNDPLRQPAVEMRQRSSGARGARQAENVLYRGPAVSAGERRSRHGDGDVAARERHP